MKDDDIKPTHKVSLYGIRCYFDEYSSTIWGTNWFWDLLLPIVVRIHIIFVYFIPAEDGDEGFPLRILEEYE